MKPSSRLALQFANNQFGPLFAWPQHDDTIARLWSKFGMHTLEEVLEDRDAAPRGRFIAAEALFSNEPAFLGRHHHAMVAGLYARALAERATAAANPWGLLWIDGSAGPIGGRLVALGDAAIAPLRELLADGTPANAYTGDAAAAGNAARYRVQDFAAFYLARIVGFALGGTGDPIERDADIARLIAALDARAPR